MRTNLLLYGAFFATAGALWAADQPFDIKPGLWNMTSTTEMSGMPPIPNIDSMSPEQRARVEAAMKGMAAKPNTYTNKSCITREGIEKAITRASSSNGCSPKLTSITSSKAVLHVDCTQPRGEMKSNGDLTIERKDSEHITGGGTIKVTGSGRSMDMKWSMTGAFVSSDCGNVKPDDK